MASAYDIVTIDGKEYFRLNKNIVKDSDVPENVRELLNPENVVDENGTIIVDEKASEAQEPTDENKADAKKAKGGKPSAGAENNNTKKEETEDDSEDDSDEEDDEDDSELDDLTGDDEEETKPEAKPAAAEPSRNTEPKFRSATPQSHPGMGFPRVNGKTVDIFDGKTPHTHVKNLGGIIVPLSAESFRTKSDGQILSRLRELNMAPIDFNAIEAAGERPTSKAGNAPRGGNAGGVILEDEEDIDDAVS